MPKAMVMVGLLLLATAVSADGGLTAAQIAARSAQVDRIEAWSADVLIQDLRNGELQREREGELSTRYVEEEADETAQRYYHFTSPQDIRDTSLLIHEHPQSQDDIWLYLPYLSKTRRIAGSAKKNSFVGTQYSFADLTSFEHARYEHEIESEEACAEQQCWVLSSIPKEDDYAREIGYSRLRSWVEQGTFKIVKIEYYDAAKALLKTQQLSQFAVVGEGQYLALKRLMQNHRKAQSSVIEFSNTDFEADFIDDDFSAYELGAN
jgi:outer membrane lipoprotein-sorting protein